MNLQDENLQSAILGDGAEYYVASQIMLNLRMLVSIAPTSAPSWDLEVTHPETGKTAKIQVKYRTRRERDSPHLRLRSGVNFNILVLIENPIDTDITFKDNQLNKRGIKNSTLHDFKVYPAWIVTKEQIEPLIYKSTNIKKGYMVRSFRNDEALFNWDVISTYLSE